ncbi:coiled-coil domain-containing protein [Sulfitobacter indolifex]|uniref:hypothetical protein n=1 Tax=Sulfitobacter indolifex TaxID=225422 RepID=UPI001FACFEFB|nr:hypothetical protein [Sulfitobacter indolifex]
MAASLAALKTASGELTDIQSRIESSSGDLAGLDERRESAMAEFDKELAALAEQRTDAETALSTELTGMTAQIEAARQDFESELAALAERRDVALTEAENVEASLNEANNQLAQSTAQLESQRSTLSGLDQEIANREARREETQTALTEVMKEVETVGARLKEARDQESTLRETLSALQAEAATLSKELAEAETRIQQARSTEAQAQEKSAEISSSVAELEDRKQQLESELSELDLRSSDLRSDVSAAEEQRTNVQTELKDMTALLQTRSDELLKVEQRIIEQQDAADSATAEPAETPSGDPEASTTTEEQNAAPQIEDSGTSADPSDEDTAEATPSGVDGVSPNQAAQSQSDRADAEQSTKATIEPGTYRTGDILAHFEADGTFNMRNEQSGDNVAGEYFLEAEVVTLSSPVGALRQGVNFPLRCVVEPDGEAFILRAFGPEGLACGPLTDAAYAKAQP